MVSSSSTRSATHCYSTPKPPSSTFWFYIVPVTSKRFLLSKLRVASVKAVSLVVQVICFPFQSTPTFSLKFTIFHFCSGWPRSGVSLSLCARWFCTLTKTPTPEHGREVHFGTRIQPEWRGNAPDRSAACQLVLFHKICNSMNVE